MDAEFSREKYIKALESACEAAIRYDEAIQRCANSPGKMSSFCTAEGDDLDFLYEDWITKSQKALNVLKTD